MRASFLARLGWTTSRSFSLARWSFRAASRRGFVCSTCFRGSSTAGGVGAIFLGRRAASASSTPMRVSIAWRPIRSWSCWSISYLVWWAHLDSNQDRTGYEPGALPIEVWARRSTDPRASGSRFQEAPQLLGARGMPQLSERLGLDLTDALAGDREVLAHFLERVLAAVGEAEAEPQHLLFSRGKGIQDLVGLLTQREPDHALHRRAHLLVLDEVAQVAVLLLADGRLERDGLLRDLEALPDLV